MSLTSLFFQILFFTTQGSSTPSQKEKREKIVKIGEKKLCEISSSHAIGASDYANNRARKQILSIDLELSVSSRSLSLPRAQAPLRFHKPWGSIKVSSDYERENTHSWMLKIHGT
jgi:hypothetical protein